MPAPRATVMRARKLRRTMTLPEGLLWRVMRTRPAGLRFRHQHPIGPYSLDFYCASVKLAIEVDGIAHEMGANPARDARRNAWVRARGIAMLRVRAVDVLADCDAVVGLIVARCGKVIE